MCCTGHGEEKLCFRAGKNMLFGQLSISPSLVFSPGVTPLFSLTQLCELCCGAEIKREENLL